MFVFSSLIFDTRYTEQPFLFEGRLSSNKAFSLLKWHVFSTNRQDYNVSGVLKDIYIEKKKIYENEDVVVHFLNNNRYLGTKSAKECFIG